ncbi:MAG: preprotein translocase subunit YajC [Bacteroidales bacterium]|nr:preprotein translocase subunit YajC [Candidatus Cryptobacteroides fimicaballi]
MITILDAAPAAAQGMGSGSMTWIMLILIFVIMWLFMIRPQRKQQKQIEEMRAALKKGDKVITAGGIKGVISEIDNTDILIKVDGEIKLRVDRNSVNLDASDAKGTK